jgi:urease accessory protein
MDNQQLLRLFQLTDPALPIGGFAHSGGLETYVQQGIVKDRATAFAFIEAQLKQNIGFTDAAFLSLAYDVSPDDFISIKELDEWCSAVKIPRELREASQKLGLRLLKILATGNSHGSLANYRKAILEKECAGHYCIAFGLYAASVKLPKLETLTGFFYTAAAGMVTNCVKLVPLGQQEGQDMLFALHPLLGQLATNAMQPDKDRIGKCCPGFDIRSMQHEQLYSRLYMS